MSEQEKLQKMMELVKALRVYLLRPSSDGAAVRQRMRYELQILINQIDG